MRTLLLGDSQVTWHEWLKLNRAGRDLICLDPNDSEQSPPGRITLRRGEKVLAWRFIGGLDPLRAPHLILAGLSELLSQAAEDAIVQLPPFHPSPLMRQVCLAAAEMCRPGEIFAAKGLAMDLSGLPVGSVHVELERSFPDLVRNAQRKAQWLKMFESCERHEVMLDEVTLEGARLGSGRRLDGESPEVLHMEACGQTLLIVTEGQLEDRTLGTLLNHSHGSRAHVVAPNAYEGLLCSFARQSGEDFGIGMIERVDFTARVAHVLNTAVAPAPVRLLRIGGLVIGTDGNERGEIRPWQV